MRFLVVSGPGTRAHYPYRTRAPVRRTRPTRRAIRLPTSPNLWRAMRTPNLRTKARRARWRSRQPPLSRVFPYRAEADAGTMTSPAPTGVDALSTEGRARMILRIHSRIRRVRHDIVPPAPRGGEHLVRPELCSARQGHAGIRAVRTPKQKPLFGLAQSRE
jgi:hypothetical protein